MGDIVQQSQKIKVHLHFALENQKSVWIKVAKLHKVHCTNLYIYSSYIDVQSTLWFKVEKQSYFFKGLLFFETVVTSWRHCKVADTVLTLIWSDGRYCPVGATAKLDTLCTLAKIWSGGRHCQVGDTASERPFLLCLNLIKWEILSSWRHCQVGDTMYLANNLIWWETLLSGRHCKWEILFTLGRHWKWETLCTWP